MTHRGAPLAVENGEEAITCEKCGLRTFDLDAVEDRVCPRCGALDRAPSLAVELIRDQWL
jgi:Zn finger protein HypA/HybF involved in hydrogenase expression